MSVWDHEHVMVMVRGYLYGDGGAPVAAREEARWAAWLAERVPAFTPVG